MKEKDVEPKNNVEAKHEEDKGTSQQQLSITEENISSTELDKGKAMQIEGLNEEENDDGRIPSDEEDEP